MNAPTTTKTSQARIRKAMARIPESQAASMPSGVHDSTILRRSAWSCQGPNGHRTKRGWEGGGERPGEVETGELGALVAELRGVGVCGVAQPAVCCINTASATRRWPFGRPDPTRNVSESLPACGIGSLVGVKGCGESDCPRKRLNGHRPTWHGAFTASCLLPVGRCCWLTHQRIRRRISA